MDDTIGVSSIIVLASTTVSARVPHRMVSRPYRQAALHALLWHPPIRRVLYQVQTTYLHPFALSASSTRPNIVHNCTRIDNGLVMPLTGLATVQTTCLIVRLRRLLFNDDRHSATKRRSITRDPSKDTLKLEAQYSKVFAQTANGLWSNISSAIVYRTRRRLRQW